MLRKLAPVILSVLGLAAGVGAGLVLRPVSHEEALAEDNAPEDAETDPEHIPEYVKFSNQFVIPLLDGGQVSALVVLSLSLEVKAGSTEAVYAKEPKLRDVLLQVMFDHANAGGFRGDFTDGSSLAALRQALREAAVSTMGEEVTDVLISDIVRQDG